MAELWVVEFKEGDNWRPSTAYTYLREKDALVAMERRREKMPDIECRLSSYQRVDK